MGKLLGGQYQFVQVLGSNGFGQTYLAADIRRPGHPKCAIKRLHLENQTPRMLALTCNRMNQKAKTLAAIGKHDRIPRVLTCFVESQDFYIVQEFVPGHPLSTEIQAGYRLSDYQVMQLLQEVLEILNFAHKKGVIHRNLKPSNIIRRHPDGKLVLTDFSLAQQIRIRQINDLTAEKDPEESDALIYIPIEQLRGQSYLNSDFYALGTIALQALTGMSAGDLAQRKLAQDCQGNAILWPRSIPVNPPLAAIIDRMVHFDSTQRYQTAEAILADLQKLSGKKAAIVRTVVPPVPMPRPQTPVVKRLRWQIPKGLFLWVGLGFTTLFLLALIGGVPQTLMARYFFEQGRLQSRAGQERKAIAAYNRVLHWQPNAAHAYYQRGVTYARLGESSAALADLTRVLHLNPENGEAYYQRGNLRLKLGDLRGAKVDYTQALRFDFKLPQTYVNRGNARGALGDEKGAMADYTRAIQRNPKLAAAYLNRCLSHANLKQLELAIADCTRAIDLRPNYSLAYQNRGLTYRRLERFQQAIEDYNIAIQLDPNDSEPYYNRGLTRADLGDMQGAIADYTQAINRNPQHLLAYYDRGFAYKEMGRRDRARQDFQKAAQQCLDLGKLDCYQDALYQIEQL